MLDVWNIGFWQTAAQRSVRDNLSGLAIRRAFLEPGSSGDYASWWFFKNMQDLNFSM
jgi:hypothetical protein